MQALSLMDWNFSSGNNPEMPVGSTWSSGGNSCGFPPPLDVSCTQQSHLHIRLSTGEEKDTQPSGIFYDYVFNIMDYSQIAVLSSKNENRQHVA